MNEHPASAPASPAPAWNPDEQDKLVSEALGARRLGLANELIARALALGPGQGRWWGRAAELAEAAGVPAHAEMFRAREAGRAAPVPAPPLGSEAGSEPKYLVIREWGAGFWADVFCTLGWIIAARLCGRVPVVFWGSGSRYRAKAAGADAWTQYFEPASRAKIVEVERIAGPRFPERWNGRALTAPMEGRFEGPHSRLSFPEVLARSERVVVADYGLNVRSLLHWIPEGDEAFGLGIRDLLRREMARSARPASWHMAQAAQLRKKLAGAKPLVGVHLRASDKGGEYHDLGAALTSVMRAAGAALASLGDEARALVVSESAPAIAQARTALGPRMVTTDVTRTDGARAPHMAGMADGATLGREVLLDSLLLAQCEMFVGLAPSNVAAAVSLLKPWPANRIHLVGPSCLEQFFLEMYERDLSKALTPGA